MLKVRLNLQIRATEVRVITEDGQQLGIMPLKKAMELANENGLDLIEVAPNAQPPVCKIIDYAKFKYQQKKAESEAKKKVKKTEVKTIWLSTRISTHDMEVKGKKIDEFLTEGDIVRIELRMRGREQAFPDLARQQLENFLKMLKHAFRVDMPMKRMGGTFSLTIAPSK
ncbi:MAG: translation initiation factor IF-3 [Patescibacteria group bacterium]